MADGYIPINTCDNPTSRAYDGVVVVTDNQGKLSGVLQQLRDVIEHHGQYDNSVNGKPVLIVTDVLCSKRLVYSCTGPINRDQDDVRRFADAAAAGVERAVAAGCQKPLLIVTPTDLYKHAILVAVLGALQEVYHPLELREIGKPAKLQSLGIFTAGGAFTPEDVVKVEALERGRVVARDIIGSDPERMAAPRVVDYITKHVVGSSNVIKMNVIDDVETLKKDYPLLAAVNRAANTVERHRGRLVFLEYVGDGKIEKTLFLVGKGITYDTGGADVKAGGVMAGMHRDKGGAAAVAGFMKALSVIKPKNIRVVAGLAIVRNSIGEESYVADEIHTSRAGVRVRVGNTDAEGRMVMADVLCRMKELAVEAVNPQLFTIATLTGHAIRCVGTAYSVILENGPARKVRNAQAIQETGDEYGDPFEITTIRREDYRFHDGLTGYEDVRSCNDKPSTQTDRGHQGPAAFLIRASGLDKHGIDSRTPLPYSHLDIAGSSGCFPDPVTGAPVVALAAHFILA